MRIDRLKLTRYGSFTDKAIDFGQAGKELDLHVVFGPNEAGKSTLRSAVVDFLYGIPVRTGYDFLHDKTALQIEAAVSSVNQQHDLVRIKRASNSLLGTDQQSVGDDLLRPLLGGVSREGYISMFSMDEDSLEIGGKSILESQGDLGELLFSSTSGLSALSAGLANIRNETEQFYKLRTRSFRLKEMNAELDALKARIKELDVPAAQYDARKKAVRDAQHNHDEAVSARGEQNLALTRVAALLACAEPWRDYLEVQNSLKNGQDMSPLPEGWLGEAQQLSTQQARLEALVDQALMRVEQTQTQLSAIEIAADVLGVGPQIDRLVDDDLEAKFRASSDQQSTQAAVDALDNQIQHCLKRLSAPDDLEPKDLPLPAARVGQIKALSTSRSGLDANLLSATEETERVRGELDNAKAALEKLGPTADRSHVEKLTRVLAAIREDNSDRELARLGDELTNQTTVVESQLSSLTPWSGDAVQLRALAVPGDDRLDEMKAQQQDLLERANTAAIDVERATEKLARQQAEQQALIAQAELISDAAAAESRSQRDAAWQQHINQIETDQIETDQLDDDALKQAALKQSAERFESLLRDDDRLNLARFSQAREVATLRELEIGMAQTQAEQQQAQEKLDKLAAAQTATAVELSNLCSQLGLSSSTSLGELNSWLQLRKATLEEQQKLTQLQRQTDEVRQRVSAALDQLRAALSWAAITDSGFGDDLRTSLRVADDILERARDAQAAAKEQTLAVDNFAQELELRERRLKTAESAMDAWNADWSLALEGLWPAAEERLPAIAEMDEILRTLDELSGLLSQAESATAELVAMQSNKQRYVDEVTSIASVLALSVNQKDPVEAADRARKQLVVARDNERLMQAKTQELEELKREHFDAVDEVKLSQVRFDEMTKLFPAESYTQLLEQMRHAEDRGRWLQQTARLQRQLTDQLGAASFDEAQTTLKENLGTTAAVEALRLEHKQLLAASEDTNQEVSARFHQYKAAANELSAIGDDGEVARLNEQVRVLLMDIEAQANRFISLSAGTLVVERALRTYLEAHRSTMLKRASAAFATITRGGFSGLDAMPGVAGKSKEELVGLRNDGSSISATEMSRGSRFQLYLSLRIAGYHEFVAEREPLPFFADDILETFDDNRSAETFGLMAEMAKSGQVIYLTHHKHLCDLATEVTNGQATIHELPARTLA